MTFLYACAVIDVRTLPQKNTMRLARPTIIFWAYLTVNLTIYKLCLEVLFPVLIVLREFLTALDVSKETSHIGQHLTSYSKQETACKPESLWYSRRLYTCANEVLLSSVLSLRRETW